MIRLRHILALTLTGGLAYAAAPILQEGMEHMMPKPTAEHAMVQKGVGQWEGTITMFIPGMPETPTPAKESVRALGKFWTISDFHSEFMGQAYSGHGAHGFDPEKGKYVSTWVDSMSSYLSIMEGEYDEASKTMTSHWEAPDMTGNLAPHRAEHVMANEDAYSMTFFTSGEKTMLIEMERKSAQPIEAGAK